MIRWLFVVAAMVACRDKPRSEPQATPIAPVARDAAPVSAFHSDKPGVATFSPPNHAQIRFLTGAADRVLAVTEDAVFVFDQHLAIERTFALPAKVYTVVATVTQGGRIVVFGADRMWTFDLAGALIANVAAPTPASVVALASEQIATVMFDLEQFEIRDVASGAVLITRHAAPNTLEVANDGTWAVATGMNAKDDAEMQIITPGRHPMLWPLSNSALTNVTRAIPLGADLFVIGHTKSRRLVAQAMSRMGIAAGPPIAIPVEGSCVAAVVTDRGLIAAFFAFESEDADHRSGLVIDPVAGRVVSRHEDGPYADSDHAVLLHERVVTTDGCRELIVMDPLDAANDRRIKLDSRCVSQLVNAGTFVIGVGDHGNLVAFDLTSLLPHS